MTRLHSLLSVSVMALALVGGVSNARADNAALSYSLVEGRNLNAFVRDGQVAAHLLLRSGRDPRILVAFPAGNSGVGLWLDSPDNAAWTLDAQPTPVSQPDAKGRMLHGIRFGATLKASNATLRQAVLSNVRVLRDYEILRTLPDAVRASPVLGRDRLDWARDRIDGQPGYRLSVTVTRGRLTETGFQAGADGTIGLRILALTGETPLTPLAGDHLLNSAAAPDTAARNALTFLSYKEKLLAGSWRFNTYFGRDTLMSVMLLMPALAPDAVEAALGSVLQRLSPTGDVAHEEDIGEFAVLSNLKEGKGATDTPIHDYKMVDDDFMLAPVLRTWLLDDARGRAQAEAFLARSHGHEAAGTVLVRNLRHVMERARPFAKTPVFNNLIRIQPGIKVGQWRDSNEGLGGGTYAYDVNAALVPAALEATDALLASGLLDRWLDAATRAELAKAGTVAAAWRAKAPGLFKVTLDAAQSRRDVETYAGKVAVPASPALASVPARPTDFHAIALNDDGTPVRVLHSDEGFQLLFGHPAAAELDTMLGMLMRPFPAGLMTDVGMLVANPVHAPATVQDLFPRNAYHGTVVWSWQQALFAAGLARQLQRTDLSPITRQALLSAQRTLWSAITSMKGVQSSELWSWSFQDGRYSMVPFGAGGGDADESNAAQLWSTVYLAVRPPAVPQP